MNTYTLEIKTGGQMPPDLFEAERPRGPIALWVRQHPAIAWGGGLLILMTCIALLAPWIASYDPANMTPMLRGKKPSWAHLFGTCLLYTSPSPRDRQKSRMPSSA